MLRLNDNGKHPNHLIYFISCYEHQSNREKQKSLDILNRIAAIVYPVMKSQGLVVKSLKEHEYNKVFAGRNFNNGEVVELVLRDGKGNWVPEQFVLQVMLHELSHIKNMNHSAAFWKTLASYKQEMSELLKKGYTGEGFWSRGKTLSGSNDVSSWTGFEAQSVCGGAFKRFRKARRSRRVLKFAGTGAKIGSDTSIRKKLDGGKRGNPRVAQSKRGKDLRLAAAEARAKGSIVKRQSLDHDDGYDGEDDEVVFIGEFENDDFEPLHRFEDEDVDIRDLLAKEMEELNLGRNQIAKGASEAAPYSKLGSSSSCAIVID